MNTIKAGRIFNNESNLGSHLVCALSIIEINTTDWVENNKKKGNKKPGFSSQVLLNIVNN